MRPLNLIITGFGTYCQRTQINLELLGNQGLYLITGDTGSGKTTIFDAITYALYGNVNGENRSVGMIRSTFAGPEIPTEVELTFEYRGKIYLVKRNPEYERLSKRGDSVTKQLADASLFMPDGNVVTGQSKVSAAIKDLLGLDANQFAQIVMIAQGDFQRLLMEDTETRQKIFREIFKTNYYRELQQRLLDEEKGLGIKRKEIENALAIFVKGLSCDPTSTLNIELEKAMRGELVVTDEIELIQKILKEDESRQSLLEEQIDLKEKSMTELRDLLSKNEQVVALRVEYNQKTEAFVKVQDVIVEARAAFEKEKNRTKEREDKEAELAVLGEELKKYQELEDIDSELRALESQRALLQDQTEEIKKECEDGKNKEAGLVEKQKTLLDAEKNYYKAQSLEKEAAEKVEAFEELEKTAGDCQKLLQKYQDLQEEYKASQKAYEDFDSNYRQMRKIYMDEQAGIIAESLEEGQPCPVCGSLEHPKPAVKAQGAPSKEELDQAEKDDKKLEQTVSAASASSAKGKADYENACKLVKESYTKLTKAEADEELSALETKITKAGQVAAKELEEAGKNLSLEKVRLDEKNQIDRELPELQTLLKEKTEELGKKNIELSAKQAKLEEKKNQAEALRKNLKFKDIDQAREAQAELENQIGQLKLAYESAQKNYEEKQNEFTSLKSQIEQLKNQLKDKKEINVDELKEKLDGLEEERGGFLSQKSLVDSRLDANKKALDNIMEQSQELAAVQEKYSYVSALSKTANGGLTGGKERIKLETFIQMTYFDRIIAHANKRLMIMSDMQYELVRRKEAADLRSQTGLELDVIDHYNGGQRSVKSLSGGESFQASLALALGLSDEVRLSAGGIKIDTMFIDEGFGTLDSEALQKAFKALSAITEGNRLVGIISHVDLLKEKIDRQILVKKARTGGSTVSIIV